MNNYRPKYCVGTTYHKLNNDTRTGKAWGDRSPERAIVVTRIPERIYESAGTGDIDRF